MAQLIFVFPGGKWTLSGDRIQGNKLSVDRKEKPVFACGLA